MHAFAVRVYVLAQSGHRRGGTCGSQQIDRRDAHVEIKNCCPQSGLEPVSESSVSGTLSFSSAARYIDSTCCAVFMSPLAHAIALSLQDILDLDLEVHTKCILYYILYSIDTAYIDCLQDYQ